jgi:hypothetical protein
VQVLHGQSSGLVFDFKEKLVVVCFDDVQQDLLIVPIPRNKIRMEVSK